MEKAANVKDGSASNSLRQENSGIATLRGKQLNLAGSVRSGDLEPPASAAPDSGSVAKALASSSMMLRKKDKSLNGEKHMITLLTPFTHKLNNNQLKLHISIISNPDDILKTK